MSAASNNARRKSAMPHAYIASKIVMVVVLYRYFRHMNIDI